MPGFSISGGGKAGATATPLPCSRTVRGRRALEEERGRYLDALFQDTVGFAAAKMIRRILGLAHNIDLEWIEDADMRAACETRCLRLARDMMVNTVNYRSINDVTLSARRMLEAG